MKKDTLQTTLDATSVTGKWIYRALSNDMILETSFDDLEFAAAIMDLTGTKQNTITGCLDMGEYGKLSITGHFLNEEKFRLTGKGEGITEGWVYDYVGYIVPEWTGENGSPKGVDQLDTLVGGVIRTVSHYASTDPKHTGAVHPAGVTASTYFVRDTLAVQPKLTLDATSVTGEWVYRALINSTDV